MTGNYPNPELWPDDGEVDPGPQSKDDLAREELSPEEQRAYFKSKKRGFW